MYLSTLSRRILLRAHSSYYDSFHRSDPDSIYGRLYKEKILAEDDVQDSLFGNIHQGLQMLQATTSEEKALYDIRESVLSIKSER